MLYNYKAIWLALFITCAVITSTATINSTANHSTSLTNYKNLKILPKDIAPRQLDSIMNAYNVALKVSCDFCHIKPKKDMFSLLPPKDEIDFALDNPMKEEARRMIQLQMDINKKYFYFDSTKRPEYLNVVSCNTCHRGNPYPAYE